MHPTSKKASFLNTNNKKNIIIVIIKYKETINMKKGLLVAYILLLAWMSLIFWFSNQKAVASDNLSGGPIKSVITFVYKIIGKEINENEINKIVDTLNTPVRKTGHFIEYLILGILVINVISKYQLDKRTIIIISILIMIIYACSDEVHQLFIEGRSGEIKDVLLDSIGGTTGILLYYKIINKKIRVK